MPDWVCRRTWLIGVLAGIFAHSVAMGQGLELTSSLLVGGLNRPLGVVQAGDGSGRLFLVQQSGQILIHDGTGVLPTPFLDISTKISCCGEKGLLGLAFHPGYAANGFFFVAYTESALNGASPPQNDVIVARYQVSGGDPNVANAASEVILMDIFQPFGNHNGGHLAFGPDGFLYIGSGDGGSGGDPSNRGQNLNTLLGKLLRIDVDSADPGRNYAVPASNPFATDGLAGCNDSCLTPSTCGSTCDEIWSYGLRNPWRFTFDREKGDLYLGDVGQDKWEEVSFQPAASTGGENYGWKVMEGTHCHPPDPFESCTPPAGHLPPILEYDHGATGGCSVTGGFVYRGSTHPRLDGVYLYGDFCSGRIWGTVPRCDGVWQSRLLLDTPFSISSFGEDEAGELFVADLANSTGEVYRLSLTAGSGGPDLQVSPMPIDFGSPPIASLEVTFTNANPGPEALEIEGLALATGGDFALNVNGGSTPCASTSPCLPPGASCTVELTFSGSGSAWFLDRLLTDSNSATLEARVGACTALTDLVLPMTPVSSSMTFDACGDVTTGATFHVTGTGEAVLHAGGSVTFGNETRIEGSLEVYAGLP